MKILLIHLIFFTNMISAQQFCYLEERIPSSTPSYHFVDNGNGTILHKKTGLIWQKCALGYSGINCNFIGRNTSFTWEQALIEAENNELANYTDWRLPNLKELEGLLEHRCNSPAINLNVFPNTQKVEFWSSSPFWNNSGDMSWRVSFTQAGGSQPYEKTTYLGVRLVRL